MAQSMSNILEAESLSFLFRTAYYKTLVCAATVTLSSSNPKDSWLPQPSLGSGRQHLALQFSFFSFWV
ncbi:hypothetical protein PHLCEN_2v4994 [Hermanssonia centrifuga]|uniref:Uncharacterized protein n=1 Tax=Hermanssonia centrifuga TaxID=98765 RepID=A0A2R6PC38_9APHY|nr:hypothetical protein PHLCEN_2v4994 [Hermanssonia centrifuga]